MNNKLEIECPCCSCSITIEKKAAAATTASNIEAIEESYKIVDDLYKKHHPNTKVAKWGEVWDENTVWG